MKTAAVLGQRLEMIYQLLFEFTTRPALKQEVAGYVYPCTTASSRGDSMRKSSGARPGRRQ
jgi:hypothetical protein